MTSSQWHTDDEELIALIRADAAAEREEEPPPEVVARAQRLLRQHRAHGARSLRHLVARLIFDSRHRPAVAGLRALGSAGRQLVFEAGEYEVDLRLASDGDLHSLSGQVL